MMALDTNALLRLILEDDPEQAGAVRKAVAVAEKNSVPVLILTEVLIEAVWVLVSGYEYSRENVSDFLDVLLSSPAYFLPDREIVQIATMQYRQRGDFSDLVIVGRARQNHAQVLLSFDKKLQALFPGFVVEAG
ncbi:MAG: type II toxin-antitoxin system VapC family toxin [Thermodesulfobacteriota bacterium]|nr:type II toxin-antitoxin system VapC family toxin [Thermodesulfobacteriota bacterium]